uniref:Rho GTPase-activating protein 15 n=1 Tax=Xenopus tropicalis TaxID=8364 RepID=G1K3J8_XENTR
LRYSALSETCNETFNSDAKDPGAVQMRIRNANLKLERLCQAKSLVLDEATKPVSRSVDFISHPQVTFFLFKCCSWVKNGCGPPGLISNHVMSFCRKNWVTSYTVLSGPKLEFYKDAKDQTRSSTKQERIDLRGASVEWANEKSSRKNVFQITTLSGNEFLFQSDADITVQEWFRAIRNTIDSLVCIRFLQIAPFKTSNIELLHLEGENTKEHKHEQRKSLIFKLNYSASDTSERNRVKTRLKKFISRRPSLKTLQEKGIIKDQVFGCHLETLCKRENETVPRFVTQCIEAVEKRGMDADGIYRVSGNLSTIQKLRFIVNQEEKLNLDDSQWDDIHVVTGALKMFFRELPEPLFPYRFFEQFVEAIKLQESHLRVKALRDLVWNLPPANRNTMKALFEHLRKIVAKASVNLMSTQSLGIVFGPTLLRPESDMGNMAVCMVYQNQIVEIMLTEFDQIFS